MRLLNDGHLSLHTLDGLRHGGRGVDLSCSWRAKHGVVLLHTRTTSCLLPPSDATYNVFDYLYRGVQIWLSFLAEQSL